MSITDLRNEYHNWLGRDIIRISGKKPREYPNFADGDSRASREIAWAIVRAIGCEQDCTKISGQRAGKLFEQATRDFLQSAFELLQHLRPGKWQYLVQQPISDFDQFEHLSKLERTISQMHELAAALGTDYIITPDVTISREKVSDDEINTKASIVSRVDQAARLTALRRSNFDEPSGILHASISCKWTLRSDRAQNARAEALNLMRNRKGHLPHVVAVTAEPLPTRLAALALGTGDLDCVYHIALYELEAAIKEIDNQDQLDMLQTLVNGRRLRDISDLPFDLAV